MKGIKLPDASTVVAKTSVFKNHRSDFNTATSFLSGLILNIHSGAQLDYANRHFGKKRYISAVDSNSGRSNCGRACRGGGGYGRGNQRVRTNNVDVTDPHRNFQAEEWETLGSGGCAYVLQLRETPSGGRDKGRDAGRSVKGQ